MNTHELLRKGFLSGLRKGWECLLWTLKILIPISFFTALLEWSGLFHQIDFLFKPLMKWLSLPAMAAFPITIGILTGIYGGIAAMAVLPFDKDQMTLIAIFMMIAHNLIQEGAIQGKSGLHPLKATFFRLCIAALTVIAVSPFFDSASLSPVQAEISLSISKPFLSALQGWAVMTLNLAIKMAVIVMAVMILLEILKATAWINHLLRWLSPLLKFLGLSERVGLIWVAGALFGIAYGAAVIVGESKEGHLKKKELELLHLSMGVNHSVIEDPLLFAAMGLNLFWLVIPRLIAAIVTVRLFSLWHSHRKKSLSKR